MKILYLYIILSLVFSQEFKVEGDLNVTGNIQNDVIDSLMQVIQNLENDINLLQNGIGDKFLELTFEGDYGAGQVVYDLDASLGSNNTWYYIEPLFISEWDGIQEYFNIQISGSESEGDDGQITVDMQSHRIRPKFTSYGPVFMHSSDG